MKKNKKVIKYIPELWWFIDDDKTELACIYAIGYYDKYGLHYKHSDNAPYNSEDVHLKGKRYRKAPYAWDSYEEMIQDLKDIANRAEMIERMGDIRKEAIYLVLDINENGDLKCDPCDIHGYVSKRGTIFNIVDEMVDCTGESRFKLTDKDKRLVFPNLYKAATYVFDNYGDWAGYHYLKSRYEHE